MDQRSHTTGFTKRTNALVGTPSRHSPPAAEWFEYSLASTSVVKVSDNPEVNLTVDERLKLRCNSPQPPTSVQWFKNHHNLKFRTLEVSDSGVYRCLLTMNKGVQTWRNISVTVLPPDDYSMDSTSLDLNVNHIKSEYETKKHEKMSGKMTKRKYGAWSESDMERALAAYRNGDVGFNECCRQYGIAKPTLKRHLDCKNVTQLVAEAYARAATVENSINGFRGCGIWPVDRNVFKDSDFLPAEYLEPSEDSNVDAHAPLTKDVTNGPPTADETNDRPDVAVEPEAGPANTSQLNVSIEAISPIPKPTKKRVSKRGGLTNRGLQRATVLTSSPYKNDLQTAKELQMAQAKVKQLKMKIEKAKENELKLAIPKIKKEVANSKKNSSSVRRNLEKADLQTNGESLPSTSTQPDVSIEIQQEEWFCSVCEDHSVEDMVQCLICWSWVHERCAGASSDSDEFLSAGGLSAMSLMEGRDEDTNTTTNSSYNSTGQRTLPYFIRRDKMSRIIARPAGNMLRLKCLAEGEPSPNITWYKNGKELNRAAGMVHYNRWSIMLEDLMTQDSGNYTCLVCNNVGCIDFSFQVDIIDPINISPYIVPGLPSNMTALVGSEATFFCEVIGSSWILWVHTPRDVPDEMELLDLAANVSASQKAKDDSNNTNPEYLNLLKVSKSDEGWYTCVAGNKKGITHSSAYLRVLDDAVNEVASYLSHTVDIGGTASFTCDELKEGVDNVTWVKRIMGENGTITEVDIKSTNEQDQNHLVLEAVNFDDEGWYTCVVCTSTECYDAGTSRLFVQPRLVSMSLVEDLEDSHDAEKEGGSTAGSYNATSQTMAPKFVRPDKMHYVVAKPAGNMLRLKCPAEGNPSPNITWFKNGEVPDRALGSIHYGRWSLMLEDLITQDSGNYTCIVCNVYDCINFTFKVDIIERFPSKPYIRDGYPHNVTALVNSSVKLECPPISDLEPYIQWLRLTYCLTGEYERVTDIHNVSVIQRANS
uniref:receptor protein-tyrosine kinase n=1 Tax=Timema douglasi TaxID=61478 RepID=A0A7R8VKU6_TIMDO|nr:unnamed protein product [Timema douglasi]